ncbi:MAG TPA: NUDIX hydrolase [Actinomycetota bacterium]|nr:NUDIX hydrolase [Actinomycetota bacterium]
MNHEVVESATPFTGGFFSVVVDRIRLPDGHITNRDYVRHPGAAAVVPVLGDEVLLVRQNRHAVGRDLLEIPAGKLDVDGEPPELCARRELEEETGYQADEWAPLGAFYSSPGFTDERFHLYVARTLRRVAPPPETDHGEPIAIEWVAMAEALAALRDGSIVDSKTVIGLLLVAQGAGQ